MRPLIFLFPHDRMDVGGNSAQVRFMEACRSFTEADAAFYGDHIEGRPHLADYLNPAFQDGNTGANAPIFVIHWGPDITRLLKMLEGQDVVYFAHSTGWGMGLPSKVPILCVSRHTMAYWGRHAPNSYIAHVSNIVELASGPPVFRDIDVLVQVRKSSRYLLDSLVPALRDHCRVEVLDGWVDDLPSWFRRSKVYLYDSLEHWVDLGATEGFGLPPLEAMGQGCVVFSSVNDALADYCDPGFNCRKIRVHSLAWDVAEVLRAVQQAQPAPPPEPWFERYGQDHVAGRLQVVLGELERFFALTQQSESDIDDIWTQRKPSTLQRARRAVRVLAGA